MNHPKISVITVCYNAIDVIEKTILSVLSQTYDNIEYIIVDGGSTDGTVDIIKKYQDRIDKWLSEPDQGIYDAMNKGIGLAKGDYINFMNAGDQFVNNRVLEQLVPYYSSNNDVIYGDCVLDKFDRRYIYKAKPSWLADDRIPSMGFNHQSSFVKTSLAKMYPFDLKYKLAADFNMMVTLFRAHYSFVYAQIPIVYYNLDGVSSENVYSHQYECLCIRNLHSKLTMKIYALRNSFLRKSKRYINNFLYVVMPNFCCYRYSMKNDIILYEE